MDLFQYYLILICLIAVAGSLLTYLMKPSDIEIAHIYLKDKRYEEAEQKYIGLWESGNHNSFVVQPLANIYVAKGEISAAVDLMESYTAENPKDYLALQQLGAYYQSDYKSNEYLSNLEARYHLKPDQEKARELARIYNFYSQLKDQKNILEDIVKAYPDATNQDYHDLAYLYAKEGGSVTFFL